MLGRTCVHPSLLVWRLHVTGFIGDTGFIGVPPAECWDVFVENNMFNIQPLRSKGRTERHGILITADMHAKTMNTNEGPVLFEFVIFKKHI